MLPHIFILRSNEAKPEQKGSERKCGILTDGRFPHDRPALIDRLRGNGKGKRDIRLHLTGVERTLKAAPFQRAVIKHRMKVERIISCPVIMLMCGKVALKYYRQTTHYSEDFN